MPHEGTSRNVKTEMRKTVVQKLESEKQKISRAPRATLADSSKLTMSVRRQPKAPIDLADPESSLEDQYGEPLDEGTDDEANTADDGHANFDENAAATSGDEQLPPPSEPSTRDAESLDGQPLVPRLPSDFLEQGDVGEDPFEPPEDVEEWNAVTAATCNEEVKSWVRTHAATIHVNKLVFDLDCSKGQARRMDQTVLDSVRQSVQQYGVIGMAQCDLVDQGGMYVHNVMLLVL